MLSEFMWQNYRLDGQYFNIVRGETLVGDQIKQVPPEVLPAMYANVAKLTKRYGDRMFADDDASKRFVKNAAYVGTITTHYRTQHANFQQSTPWPFPVHGGRDNRSDRLQRRRACVRVAREVCDARRLRLRLRRAVGHASARQLNSRQSTAANHAGARTSVLFTTRCATHVAHCFTKFPKTF